MAELAEFWEEMRAFLLGEQDAAQVQAKLGESRSGTANLAFYRTLIRRNFDKFLADMYPSVKITVEQIRHGWWAELVDAYAPSHPPDHFDPNRFSAGFPEFLAARRQQDPKQPTILEELADFQWLRHQVNIAPDIEGDGFEHRLFIRQYAHQVPRFWREVSKEPATALPAPRPTFVVVYRDLGNGDPKYLVIGGPELAVLARRQGLELPPPLDQIDPDQISSAEEGLVGRGVLVPRPD